MREVLSSSLVSTPGQNFQSFSFATLSPPPKSFYFPFHYASKQVTLLGFRCGGARCPGEVPGSKDSGAGEEEERKGGGRVEAGGRGEEGEGGEEGGE